MLITGLAGAGRSWGTQIERFASRYRTIVPDHRGTGASGRPDDGYTVGQHAADMAAVLRSIDCGPAHVVGSSTGGAMAQVMALDHADLVASITLADSWTTADDYFRHQFGVRRRILLEHGQRIYAETTALFLFGHAYIRDHHEEVAAWIDIASAGDTDPALFAKRIDMIVEFDETDRLGTITTPTLVLVGDGDICTPPYFSRALASAIPGAHYRELPGGHLIYKESPGEFFDVVADFIDGTR